MICIEGVVGVGKSSLMNLIAQQGYVMYEEPVVDNPILEKFYYDRKRWSFPLQVFFLNQRFINIKSASKIEKSVMDRSIYGDAIFAKMLELSGDMSREEFSLYESLLNNMLEHVARPKLMISLECSVDEAISRIQKRGRDYEQVVERAYWQNLHDQYELYFKAYDLSPMLRINVDNLDFENNKADQDYVLKCFNEKINEIG